MKTKRLLMSLLAIVIAGSFAKAEVLSGTCGENVTYTLDTESGLLKFEGTGEIWNYSNVPESAAPWYSKRNTISKALIADGITEIGRFVFFECSKLSSITISESVTSIGDGVFLGCSALTSITIPNSVTSIGKRVFRCCTGELTVNCNIPTVSSADYSPFRYSRFSSVKFGENVTKIGNYAFRDCPFLNTITFSESLARIGVEAFSHCSNLTSVVIPNSVTFIGNRAFDVCM